MTAYTRTRNGPPTGGRYSVGDTVTDASNVVWTCVVGGMSSGDPAQPGYANFVASTVGDSLSSTPGTASVATVTAAESYVGVVHKTVLTLTNVAQAVVNGTEYQGTKVYDFPEGRILLLGCIATLQQKTTSVLASTLNASSTGAVSLGSVTASNVSLTSTMVDMLPSTAFTSSATINVAGTAVSAALAASAQFNGTTTAIDMYLNSAYATTTDVDADATQTWTGSITFHWVNLGDY